MGPTENDCLTCSNNLLLQNNKCVSTCDKGYFMEAGVCTLCLHTCTQCVSRMNCTECVKGLQLQSGECRATCADGWVERALKTLYFIAGSASTYVWCDDDDEWVQGHIFHWNIKWAKKILVQNSELSSHHKPGPKLYGLLNALRVHFVDVCK